ncbi:DNA repair protein complementing XP-C cells homolog isoform X1 [Amphibalanus amphitrite]|uniref:DNA repair protein complementing XP-C cells homolog isoform X1 n=1 Tax=Amphibalanus amphitrite TaxID=1232801 RepID=UPI001C908A79|nr:DNA repair protein complementing XP-C cells homolog isoform X1 [Amphibalanus amphitrite]XP_043229197.1 DNA repair protein complementing XP-C cells homolog isoform X1 [Amphibalanus amphitrite]
MRAEVTSRSGQPRRSVRNAAPSPGPPGAPSAVMADPSLSPAKKLAKMLREGRSGALKDSESASQSPAQGKRKGGSVGRKDGKPTHQLEGKSKLAKSRDPTSTEKSDQFTKIKQGKNPIRDKAKNVSTKGTSNNGTASNKKLPTKENDAKTKSRNHSQSVNGSAEKRSKHEGSGVEGKRPKKDKPTHKNRLADKESHQNAHEASTSSPTKKHHAKKQRPKAERPTAEHAAAAGDIAALLRLGEGADGDAPMSDDSDWEAVDTRASDLVTKGFVEVTLPSDVAVQKRKKKGFDVEAYMKRQLSRARRELQQLVHRAHLLCLLSRALQVNALLNSETQLACAMSMLPSKYAYPPKRVSISYVEKFLKWFREKVPLEAPAEGGRCSEDVFATLEVRLRTKKAHTPLELVCLFVLILRAIGVDCRLVMSLQPVPLKPSPPTSAAAGKTAAAKSDKSAAKAKQQSKKKETSSSNSARKTSETPKGKARSAPTPPARTGSNRKAKQRPGPSAAEAGSSDDSSGDEFEPRRPDRRVLSSSSGGSEGPPGRPARGAVDCWAEVYVEEELRWISVDVVGGGVHCVTQIRKRATAPLVYVVGCDNAGHIKDLTARYDPKWHSSTRKLRVEPDWWSEATDAWRAAPTRRDKEEDEEMMRDLQERPMPQSIAEFKDHPLYALERHLLKFEAIYPPTAVPLGYIGKGERRTPVYARECVRTLHSRETWIKQARVVKEGEKPYKIVKARPKWDRVLQKAITDKPLEVFGRWQTAEYVPPRAEGGKVPRNDYGNVELFKPSMLPGGTVHLNVEGLSRVAKRLGIDCAPAMVGWDYHCGGSHPVFEGYVVCEEFEDTLMDAWEADQREARRRQREKREKRILDNWRRLVRGLLIRQRLARKYDFQDEQPGAKRPAGAHRPDGSKKARAHTADKPGPGPKTEPGPLLPNFEPKVEPAQSGAKTAVKSEPTLAGKVSAMMRATQGAKQPPKRESKRKPKEEPKVEPKEEPKGAGSEDEEVPETQEEVARRVEASMASMGLRRVALSSDSEAGSDAEDAKPARTGARFGAAVMAKLSPAVTNGAARSPAPAGRKRRSAPAARRRARRASPASRSPSPDPAVPAAVRAARRRSARTAAVNYRETAGSGSDEDGEAPIREDDLTSDEEQPFAKAADAAASSGEDSDFMGF